MMTNYITRSPAPSPTPAARPFLMSCAVSGGPLTEPRLSLSDTGVEFLLSRESLSPLVVRAELHLQLSNPLHLDVRPALSALAKRHLPTR